LFDRFTESQKRAQEDPWAKHTGKDSQREFVTVERSSVHD